MTNDQNYQRLQLPMVKMTNDQNYQRFQLPMVKRPNVELLRIKIINVCNYQWFNDQTLKLLRIKTTNYYNY